MSLCTDIVIWWVLYAKVCLSSLNYLYILNSLPLIFLWAFEKLYSKDTIANIIGNCNVLKTWGCHLSHDSPQVHRLGVLLLKSGPLNNEVIGEVPQNLPRQGQSLHPADALHIDNDHFLYSEYSKEQGRHTDRNACSWSITQHQIWLYSVNQWEGQPHGVQGGEDGGEPGLPNLPASGNSVKVVVGVFSSRVALGPSEFERVNFLGAHLIRLGNDVMPW